MAQGTKIATCNYCGTRAALVLRGKTRHELACASCGAPLHDLKSLKVAPTSEPKRKKTTPRVSKPASYLSKPSKSRKKHRKKRGIRWFLEEAFDVLEDVFD